MSAIARMIFFLLLVAMFGAGVLLLTAQREFSASQSADAGKIPDFKVFERFFEAQNEKAAHYDQAHLSPAVRHKIASAQYGGVNPYEDDDDKLVSSEPLPSSQILLPHSDPYEFKGLSLDPIRR